MKVTRWTCFGSGLPIISCWKVLHSADIPLECYEGVRQSVIRELRDNNYHFSGDYHQNGDFGCPIIDDKYSFEVSEREWGAIMAEAYPNEDYAIYDKRATEQNESFGTFRYLKWAFTSGDSEVVTPYTKRIKVSDTFSYVEEKSPFEDDIIIYNSDGCSWCNGVGTNPNGVPCGECTNICKEYCPARKLDDDTPEFIEEC